MQLTATGTERFGRAVRLARDEATGLGSGDLGTVHLLLGLVVEGRESADGLIAEVDPDRVRGLLPLGRYDDGPPALSPHAAASVEAARRLAERRTDRAVGVAHLLAGVLTHPSSGAAEVLDRLGIDAGDVYARAVAALPHDRSSRAVAADGPVLAQLDAVMDMLV